MNGNYFTCNSCMIQFRSSDQQRYHMKTDWHRYNLKRRVSQLAPISADLFAEKLQVSESAKEHNNVDEFGFPILKPRKIRNQEDLLKKRSRRRRDRDSNTKNTVRSISPAASLASQVSKLSVYSKDEVPTDFDEEKSYDNGFTTDSSIDDYSTEFESEAEGKKSEDRPDIKSCIFCSAKNHDLERNVKHMFASHGLYVPERTYLVNLPGLLNYLIDIILVEKECLCCSYKGSSVQGIRAHIASKGHCRVPYELKEERARLAEFYDFSLAEESAVTAHKPKGKSVGFNVTADVEKDEEPAGESFSDDDTPEINSNFVQAEVDDTGVELTLPSGFRAGHRSMRRFYRQNLPLPPSPPDGNRTVAVGDRRYLGGVTDKSIRKNDKKVHQIERKVVNRDIRMQTRRSNFQTHYRDELLQ